MTVVLAVTAHGPSDLIRPMIDHHLAQGVQQIVITFDDEPTDALDYVGRPSWKGRVTVGPAPRAAELADEDWLLSAHADEFWVCTDSTTTVADALRRLSEAGAAEVAPPVLDLSGYGGADRRSPIAVRVADKPTGHRPVQDSPRCLEVVRVPGGSAATSAHIASLEATVQRYASRRVVRALDTASRAARASTRLGISEARRGSAALREGLRRARESRSRLIQYRTMLRLVDRRIAPIQVAGSPRHDAVPVIMCLWNRPQRLSHILEMLAAQCDSPPLRLMLWNNNPADTPGYMADIGAHSRNDGLSSQSALSSVELFSSPRNIGGIARFVLAHMLWNDGVRGAYVMLDDDQDVGPLFIHDLLAEYRARSIRAWWAYHNEGSYWNRFEIEPGEEADYAGTGGTVADIEIASERSFFEIDPRYLMLEDQWMTHYARQRGWDIRKAHVSLEQVLEETNQYHALRPLKDEFYAFLHAGE